MKANDILTKPDRTPGTLFPSVVLTLPFDPKMNSRSHVNTTLRDALTRAARGLMDAYPGDIALAAINRLEGLTCNLNYATNKRSIALSVSAETEKILYLAEALEEQVLVDSGFRIRDLTIPHPSRAQYYVLLLSGGHSKMYMGVNHRLQLIENNIFWNIEQCSREQHEGGTARTKPYAHKHGLPDKFLYHVDAVLDTILGDHSLPVFVLASAPVIDNFSRITRNDGHIAVYIHQSCFETTEEDLLDLLQPYLDDWSQIRQQMALKHIAIAEGAGKLDCGIEAVSKSVHAGNSRLLIIERGFSVAADNPYAEFFIRDRVDALIEKVLERGGQVEWVDKGKLQDQAQIGLVRY